MSSVDPAGQRQQRPIAQALTLIVSLTVLMGLLISASEPVMVAEASEPRRERARDEGAARFKPVEARDAVSRRPRRGAGAEIVGGSPVPQGTFSFATFIVADVGGGFATLCTGSLVDALHVVTAAHCVEDESGLFDAGQFTLVIGRASNVNPPPANLFEVDAVAQHPQWSPETFANDVAVLRLDRAVPTDIASPITLIAQNDTRFDAPGQSAIAAGWGLTFGGADAGSPNLLQIKTTVISDAACDALFNGGIEEASVFCAQVPARSVCSGDSGGPLFMLPSGSTAAQQAHRAKQGKEVNADRRKRKKRRRPGGSSPPPAPTTATLIGVTSFGGENCPPGGPNGFAQLSAPIINGFVTQALND